MTSNLDSPSSGPAGRREILAWVMYDWANSAYSTLVISIVMLYLTSVVLPGGSGESAYAYGIGVSTLVAAILSPIVGAMADVRRSKRKWLTGTTLVGAAAMAALGLSPPDSPWFAVGFFFVAGLCFELSLGFNNAFLPELVDDSQANRLSAWGFSAGYVGGGLALVAALGLLFLGERIGLSTESSKLRAGIVLGGVWWAAFSVPTLLCVRDRGKPAEASMSLGRTAVRAVSNVGHTLRNVRRYRMLAVFLVGYLFFNDGVQTVISQAAVFAKDEIKFTKEEIVVLVLIVQFLALPGALAIGRLSDGWGQKPTLMLCLFLWVALLTAAWFITTKTQLWILAVVLAMIMGGTQSVSRAIMSVMTPASHSAEFFGFFNFSGKATAWMGPILFAQVNARTGSARWGIVSLLVFVLVGWAIAACVNVERGAREAE